MIIGSDLNTFLHAVRQRLNRAGEDGGLAPPCDNALSFAEEFYRNVGTSLPDEYISLLREFDGLIVQDVEYFGSRRRLLGGEDEGQPSEKFAISSILEENVSIDRINLGERMMILFGRWEGGHFCYDCESHSYCTLDHLNTVGERVGSLAQFIRFTIGCRIPL